MADELPLADVTAYVSHQRSSNDGQKSGYAITVQVGHGEAARKRADQKQMDNFLRGPNGKKLVRCMFFPLPDDWKPAVDPDQGEEEVDPHAQLQAEWSRIIAHMTDNADVQP